MSEPVQKQPKPHNWRMLWWAFWSIAGISIMVASYLLGYSYELNDQIRASLSAHPFYLAEDAFSFKPLVILMLCIGLTLFFTQVLLYTPLLVRRLFLLVVLLVTIVLTTIVAALWGSYLPPLPFCISFLVSGLGASLTAMFIRTPESSKQ